MATFFATNGFLIISMLLAAMLALSLYLPLMAGQLSLASPGFYALGGYIAAVLATRWTETVGGQSQIVVGGVELARFVDGTFPIWLVLVEMLLGGLAAGALALVVGLPALRLRGIYLALATIAFVEILRVLSLNMKITGEAVGIFGIPQPFHSQIAYLWIVGPLLLLSGFFVYRLERVRVGRALTAIREDELAAAAMGINPTGSKVLAFTLGAVLAGMVGAVSAHFLNTWNARQGTFDAAIAYLAFVLIGGSRTFAGPIVGGMLLTALPELLRKVARLPGLPPALTTFLTDGRLILYGVLIVVGSIFFPQGVITPALLARLGWRRVPRPAAPRDAAAEQ